MDFLKTLLIYMTLTFAMTVQEAPAPGASPEPTAVPEYKLVQSIGTPTPKAEITPAPTATPKPADPTRSAPTITPNTRYKTIQYGDRGTEVTKLQRRLIELGYMKKGSDDGSYGYQTLNAVRDFQKANGLTSDGAAGRVTLTCLYEDPNVVAHASAATAAPTAAPETVAPVLTPAPAAEPQATEAQSHTLTQVTNNVTTATEAPVTGASVTDAWQPVEGATVLLNGNMLVLLQRTNDVIAQRKPSVWMRDGVPMVSLDDLAAASGSWKLVDSAIDQAQMVIAGYQIALTAVADTSSGTCEAYTATVNGVPCPMNDGDIICSRGKWYISPSFLVQVINASAVWDAQEQTLVILAQDASLAGSLD